ncbi:MAG: alcohol dehydrogenase catalytic domain-containing protein [Lentisphaerae bacterium]|nr:alcohol dehydrogenase catalytic domain-containing protein [Lentisphaerota bacterium]
MMAATYEQGKGFAVAAVPEPDIGPDEILVQVRGTAICGTDTKIIRVGSRRLQPGQRIVLGHEFVGMVSAVGASVQGLAVGARVGVAPNFGCGRCEACIRGLANMCADYSAFGIDRDGSHAAFVKIPARAIVQGNVVELPTGVAWAEAALAEPLSCVLNAQRGVNLAAGETVLIYGLGPMGLLHTLLAAATGAARIIAVDPAAHRLDAARAAGATVTLDSSRESVSTRVLAETGGRGVDVAIVAAPVAAIVPEALTLLAPFGRLCLFAGLVKGKSEVTLDANAIHYRNLHVTGTTGGSNADYRAALRLIAARRVDVRPVISHTLPLAQLREAYDLALAGQGLKIVLTGE